MSATAAPGLRPAPRVAAPAPPAVAERSGGESTLLRLACFAALAAWGSANWAGLIEDSQSSRAIGEVVTAVAGCGLLILIGRSPLAAPLRHAAAAVVGVVTVAVGLVVAGLPAALLKPARWDELGDGLDRGLSGVRTVEWPYGGEEEWVRLVILLGAPLLLGVAAALTFWPARRFAPILRGAALVVLLLLYGVAVTEHDPGAPLGRGLVLLGLVAAWLWLPRLSLRTAGPGAALVLAVGIVAMPVAARLNADNPWWDYREWNWFGSGKVVAFDWNHSYGPLEWPREGTTLLNIKSDRPHYWKTEVLDRFDGFRWVRSEPDDLTPPTADLPRTLDPRWDERLEVTVRALRTDLVVGAGTTYLVIGVDNVATTRDGTSRMLEGPLERGDHYEVRAYAPNPSAREMRAANFAYEPEMAVHTQIYLPNSGETALEGSGREIGDGPLDRRALTMPLVEPVGAEPLIDDTGLVTPGARAAVLDSSYADVYRLARRLTEGQPTIYDAVKSVERHLQETYTYSERVSNSNYPLAAFLFRDERGYCQQFSGAMALMLRMSGIPARVAGGFSPGSFNRDSREWRVRDLDAHSWVEVNFPGIGWVPFDPTPPAAPAEAQSGGASATSAAAGDAREAPLAELSGAEGGPQAGVDRGSGDDSPLELWMVPLALVAIVAACMGWLVVADRRRHGRLQPAERVDVQLRELERALRRLGWPLPAGTTLLGLEQRLARVAGPASAAYAAGIRAHRFAPGPPSGPSRESRGALRRELAGRGFVGRLRALRALPPFLGRF